MKKVTGILLILLCLLSLGGAVYSTAGSQESELQEIFEETVQEEPPADTPNKAETDLPPAMKEMDDPQTEAVLPEQTPEETPETETLAQPGTPDPLTQNEPAADAESFSAPEADSESFSETAPESDPAVETESPQVGPETSARNEQGDLEEPLTEPETETEQPVLKQRGPVLKAAAEYVGKLPVTISMGTYYAYSSYGLGSYGTGKYRITIDGIASKAYGFCANPALDGPKTGTYRIETAAASFTKIMYYGLEEYSKEKCFFTAKGHSSFSEGKRYIIIHLAVAQNNNSQSLSKGATSTALSLANDLRSYAASMPNPPSADLSLSQTHLAAYQEGNIQRTPSVTLRGDAANSVTVPLPAGVTLVNEKNGSRGSSNVKVSGGDTFHLEAPLNQASVSGKTWNSPVMTGSVNKAFSGYRVAASWSGALQDLLFLQTKDVSASVSLSVDWTVSGGVSLRKVSDHDMLTDVFPLTGAEYGIFRERECIDPVTVMRLDGNGSAGASDLQPGTYFIKEMTPPECGMYELDPQVYEVNLNEASMTGTVNSEDRLRLGSIVLQKTCDSSDGSGVEGIRFVLTYEDESKGIPAREVTTDEKGFARAEGLVPGTWKIREDEQSVPLSYSVAKEQEVDLTEALRNGETERTVIFENKQVSRLIRIRKEDSEKQPVCRAVFQILNQKKEPVSLTPAGEKDRTDRFVTDPLGEISFKEPLPAGTYTLTEVDAPDIYRIPDSLKKGIAFTVDRTTPEDQPIILTAENETRKGKIRIVKEDLSKPGETVKGRFTFRILAAEAIPDPSGNVRNWNGIPLEKGALLETITTGDDGIAESSMLYPGKYIIEEVCVDREAGLAVSKETLSAELTIEAIDKAEKSGGKAALICPFGNSPTEILVQKKDAVSGKDLKGIEFTLTELQAETREKGDSRTAATDSKGEILFTHLKAGHTYILKESKTLPGYNQDPAEHRIAVGEDGTIEGEPRCTFAFTNMPNRLDISKTDIADGEGGKELPGAYMVLLTEKGKEIDSWVSGEKPHRITGLTPGAYILRETAAPSLYEESEEVRFTLTDSMKVQRVTMYDAHYQEAEISKKAITGQEELPGARLTIVRETEGIGDGNIVVESWISGETPHSVFLPSGDYLLIEEQPADGYTTAESVPFHIEKMKPGDSYKVTKVEMKDSPTQIEISKKDITLGEESAEIPGAGMEVRDSEGNLMDSWVSGETPHLISKLPVGTYTLTETTAPEGYEVSETVAFRVDDKAGVIQKAVMYDKPFRKVLISKTSLTGGAEIPGAHLRVTKETGETVEEWVSAEETHEMELPSGDYVLTETLPADGYVTAESIRFRVSPRETEGDDESEQISMKDDVTKVSLSKTDITTGKELPGARLVIKDLNGNTMAEWTSSDQPYYIEKLPIGRYTLTEITAPEGYLKAETVHFEVKDTEKIQKVRMEDRPVTKEIKGGGSEKRNVRKRSPKTGDETPVLRMAVLLFLGGLCTLFMLAVLMGRYRSRHFRRRMRRER